MAAAYQEQAFRAYGFSVFTLFIILLKFMMAWVKIKI